MVNSTITRSQLQTLLTDITVIKNLQSKCAIDPSRFNDYTYEACDLLLGLTPPLHTIIFIYYNTD